MKTEFWCSWCGVSIEQPDVLCSYCEKWFEENVKLEITDPEHSPEQSPDNSDKTPPVFEPANHGERSKLCEPELKA